MAKQPSKKMKALLVGIQTGPTSDAEHARSMAELARLVDTLGMQVVHVMNQKLKTTNGSSLVGPGKLLEIAKWSGGTGVVEIETHQKISKARLKQEAEFEEFNPIIDSDKDELEDGNPSLDQNGSPGTPKPQPVDFVIFDSEMTPTQNRNLQQALECEVLDRTGVIVEIFHRHAQSPAARAQVEIARLTYLTPRIRATGGGDRQGGGIGAKGAGETKHELDKRRIRDRIAELKTTLEVTHKENALRRSRRRNNLKVALVGYTNAGKSSLMRALTGSEVLVADKLFATLDTTVRALQPETKPKIIATDTVGFIQKLPHELVASFKSTLDEAMDASLLLYVVDASDPAFRDQLKTTVDVLTEIEAHLVPHILILNKSDRLSPSEKNELTAEFPQGVLLSTRDQETVLALRNQLVQHFEKGMETFKIHIPYSKAAALSEIHSVMQVTAETHGDEGTTIQAKGFSADFERIKKSFKL